MGIGEEEEVMVVGRKPRKKKKTSKWNMLYFQHTKVLEEKQPTGPKKRPIRMGHKLFKELSCLKCFKTFHKRISLALHNTEFHKNDKPKKKQNKSKSNTMSDDVLSLSGNSSSSTEFSDAELSKQFKEDVKDETEDDLFSSDDEFNEAWEKENLPEPKQTCRGPGSNRQRSLTNLPESQRYGAGEWEWMINHGLFSPAVLLDNSLNVAWRRCNQQATISASDDDNDFDDIESILGPDSDDELITEFEMNCSEFSGLNENQPICDTIVHHITNDDDAGIDEISCIELLSSESEEESDESDEHQETANIVNQKYNLVKTTDRNLNELENDPQFNCSVVLDDFVRENVLKQLKSKYHFSFDFPNDDKNAQNGCESDSESSADGSCIVLSSSEDDLDEDEALATDYDDYSDDACCILDEDDDDPETILPHAVELLDNDIIEIDD